MKGMQASALSSEFRTSQVLEGPKALSALRNSEVSAVRSIQVLYFNWDHVKWLRKRGGCYWEVSVKEGSPVWPERLQVFSPGDERRRVSIYHTGEGDVLPSISHDLGRLH